MRRTHAAVIALATVLAAWPADSGRAGSDIGTPVDVDTEGAVDRSWEHRYRISGKVRLLMIWVGDNDVGSARMRLRQQAGSRTISFLGGSDPTRAPRKLNMWGYAFEEAGGDSARVFMLRSLGEADDTVVESRLADAGSDGLFGASCGQFDPDESSASITGVRVAPTLTYREFDEVLGAVSGASRWLTERSLRRSGVYPGFFSALQSVINDSVAGARVGLPLPRLRARSYIYKGLPFELQVQKVEAAGQGRLRGKFLYRNRTTGNSGDFFVTYGTEGDLTGVPVAFSVQPNWWLRLELTLDDGAEAPEDPAHDAVVSRQIADICGRALSVSSVVTD
jgi:hypothetical protein